MRSFTWPSIFLALVLNTVKVPSPLVHKRRRVLESVIIELTNSSISFTS